MKNEMNCLNCIHENKEEKKSQIRESNNIGFFSYTFNF